MAELLHTLNTHPDRQAAYDEVHARPFPMVESPLLVSFVGLLTSKTQAAAQRSCLAGLALDAGQPPPAEDADCYYQAFSDFDLRWERHQEFCTLTILKPCSNECGFDAPAIGALPRTWLENLPGDLMVGFHGLVLEGDTPLPGNPQLMSYFEGQTIFGSRIVDNRAAVWTTFRLHSDGFARFVLYNTSLSRFQAGRTLQRVMEIETYRVMTLLGLPLARKLAPEAADMDQSLAEIMERIHVMGDSVDEKALLNDLSELAARVETIRAGSKYRFSATQAYHALVQERLLDIREVKFSGVSTLANFLKRRLTPAVRTCAAVEDQLKDLSRRISRASDLLRAGVDLSIEEQNQALLESMNKRSGLQLRLQQTVEGLSVVVISYYSVGLIRTVLKAMEAAGVAVKVDLLTGLAVIPVVLAVWGLVRRVRRQILG